jgi:hypothetical protein
MELSMFVEVLKNIMFDKVGFRKIGLSENTDTDIDINLKDGYYLTDISGNYITDIDSNKIIIKK